MYLRLMHVDIWQRPTRYCEAIFLQLKTNKFGDKKGGGTSSLEKTLMLGKTEGKRRRVQQRMRWLNSITNLMGTNVSHLLEMIEDRGA